MGSILIKKEGIMTGLLHRPFEMKAVYLKGIAPAC